MIRKLLKALHFVGAAGVLGAIATSMVLIANAPDDPTAYAALRQSIVRVNSVLLVPSLATVLISGLLAIAATDAYKDAGWAWLKALLGLVMFEGSLLTIVGSARKAAEYAAQAAAGDGVAAVAGLEQALRTEWGGLWVMLVVSLANVVLGVWRPRLQRRRGAVTS